jgi:hypothetical protein
VVVCLLHLHPHPFIINFSIPWGVIRLEIKKNPLWMPKFVYINFQVSRLVDKSWSGQEQNNRPKKKHVQNSSGQKGRVQKTNNIPIYTLKRIYVKENNQGVVSHTQRCCGIKRMDTGSVHMFHIVNNYKTVLIASLDNVYCSAKIRLIDINICHSLSYSKSKRILSCQ